MVSKGPCKCANSASRVPGMYASCSKVSDLKRSNRSIGPNRGKEGQVTNPARKDRVVKQGMVSVVSRTRKQRKSKAYTGIKGDGSDNH